MGRIVNGIGGFCFVVAGAMVAMSGRGVCAQVEIATMPGALPHVKSAWLRALGVSSLTRAPALPDLPAIAESGLPGYDYVAWFGVFAPGATPQARVARIDTLTQHALADVDLKSKLELAGVAIQTSTPAQFHALLKGEITRWKQIIVAAGIKTSP